MKVICGKALMFPRAWPGRRPVIKAHWLPSKCTLVQASIRRRSLRNSARSKRPPSHSCVRSEEHTSELQSLMRISYAVFCLKKKNKKSTTQHILHISHTTKLNHKYEHVLESNRTHKRI